ncbi:hypothetical protein AN639_04065 [Candidatus Epulonipiscium fishelsonii]|nr:hypothetical protein AN639_04065 [Epulopiscium sp. SCG-B05WGA-EpuloA1]
MERLDKMELLSPTIDFIFKKIFGEEKNKDLLIDFLNAVLRYETPIVDLEYLDTIIKKEYIDNKYSILDIKSILSNGVKVNIEIQVRDTDDMLKRSLYYWAKNYSADLKQGEFYSDLKGVICINILNYKIFEDDEHMHHKFTLYDKKLKKDYNQDLELHFIELNKLDLRKNSNKTKELKGLIDWLTFIKTPNSPKIKKLGGKIYKAIDVLTELSGDEKIREAYFERHMMLIEEGSALNKARQEGRQEGFNRGIQEGIEKTAISLLDILEDEIIALKTGLNIEVVRNLRKSNNTKAGDK